MRCTGACCGPIKLWNGDGDRVSMTEVCAIVDRDYGNIDVAKLKALLMPTPSADDVRELTCRAFDREARRCTVYDDRPRMCQDYPDNMWAGCPHCGAYSDAEARGVALQVT